jgi:hypothetical protein
VRVADVQAAAEAEQTGDDGRPPGDVRQPAQCTDAGVDEVERAGGQHVERPVDVGLDEADLGAGPCSQAAALA